MRRVWVEGHRKLTIYTVAYVSIVAYAAKASPTFGEFVLAIMGWAAGAIGTHMADKRMNPATKGSP